MSEPLSNQEIDAYFDECFEADWTYSVPSVDGKLRAFLAVFLK